MEPPRPPVPGSPPIPPPRRRATLGLCAALVAGTTLGILCPLPGALFLTALFALLLPLFVLVRHPHGRPLLFLAVLLLGAANARIALAPGGARSLASWVSRKAEYARIIVLAEEDARPESFSPNHTNAVFRARLLSLNRDGLWRSVQDPIRVILHAPLPSPLPHYGEHWLLAGRLESRRPRPSGLFTLPENLAIIEGPRASFLSPGHGFPLKAWCMARRRAASAILSQGLDAHPETTGILQALLLGYRERLPHARRQEFADTGTIHIFAISGAHVGIVTFILLGFLRMLGIPRHRQLPFLAPALLLYVLMTGAATSAIRAYIMAVACCAAPFFGRRQDAPSALALAAILILLFAPLQLGDLGFLLSFTAVASLCALVPLVHACLLPLQPPRRPPLFLPTAPLPFLQRCRLRLCRWTWNLLAAFGVSTAAWIGTAPLTATFFNIFSPIALLLNLFVIPAASGILLAGFLSLLASPLSSALSQTFNFAALGICQLLVSAIRLANNLPGAHFFIRSPPAPLIATAYLILFAGATLARSRPRAIFASLALLALLAAAFALYEKQAVRLVLLPAGNGNALLLQAKGENVMIDVGPARPRHAIPRALRRQGVNRLSAILLTHADSDHTGALENILRETPVNAIYTPSTLWPNTPLHARLAAIQQQGIPLHTLSAGDTGSWGRSTITYRVLWPPSPFPRPLKTSDDASLVLHLHANNPAATSLLLPADAPRAVESNLLAASPPLPLAADLLLLPAHGTAASSSPDFLSAVHPRLALLSAAPPNTPAPEVQAALDQAAIPLRKIPRNRPLILTLHSLPFLPPFTLSPN